MSWFRRKSSNAERSKSPFSSNKRHSSSLSATLRQQAEQELQRGNVQGAINIYSSALVQDSRNSSLFLDRSLAFLSLPTPDNEGALHDADAAIDIEPGSWRAWSQKGNALSALARYAEADQALQHAIRLAGPMDRVGPQQMLSHVRRMKGTVSPQSQIPSPSPASNSLSPQAFSPGSGSPNPSVDLSRALPSRPAQNTQSSPTNTTTNISAPQTQTAGILDQSNTSSEPPPQYTASQPPTAVATSPLTGSSLGAIFGSNLGTTSATTQPAAPSLTDRTAFLSAKLHGSTKLTPYSLPGQIDFVKLSHHGLTALESLVYDIPTITFAHETLKSIHCDKTQLPGNKFLDYDTESALHCVGLYPGTRSVAGASEEYREAQLAAKPAVKITLEAQTTLPELEIGAIINRLQVLKASPAYEDDAGLFSLLGITLAATATRVSKIDELCLRLNRGFIDHPQRFKDFRQIRNFCPQFLATAANSLRDFLFQILIGAEIYLRTIKEPSTTSYENIITEQVSAMMLVARNFMDGVSIKVIQPTAATQTAAATAPRYQILAERYIYFRDALLAFAQAIQWPYMQETRHYLEDAARNLAAGPPTMGDDMTDWLYGLTIPGKFYRHRLMCSLVNTAASIKSLGPAPLYLEGLVAGGKSYWPDRSALGRVLGGLADVQWHCGWIGPVTVPITGVASPAWVYSDRGFLPVEIPATNSLSSALLLGFESEEEYQRENPMNLMDPTKWKAPAALPQNTGSSATLKSITLSDPQPVTTASGQSVTSKQFRVTMDFTLSSGPNAALTSATFVLYSTPLFVTAPRCSGAEHPIFHVQSKRVLDNCVKVSSLINFDPPRDKMVLINAKGTGEETVARAWCSERRRNAMINRGTRCCFACSVLLVGKIRGLGYNTLIWA